MTVRTEEFIAALLPYGCVMVLLSIAGFYSLMRTDNYLWIGMMLIPGVLWFARYHKRNVGILWLCSISVISVLFVAHYEHVRTMHVATGQHSFMGTVIHMPDRRYDSTYITVRMDGAPRHATTRIRVDKQSEIRYGTRVQVSGNIVVPQSFVGGNGTVFDYPRYLAVRDIVSEVRNPEIKSVGYQPDSTIVAWLYSAHDYIVARLSAVLPAHSRGLALGMVLGDRSFLPDAESDIYRIVGLSHIIVLSGFNVSIVGIACARMGLLMGARRNMVIIASAILIAAFVVMAGASVSLVRAAIMIGAVLVARMYYRQSSAWRGLLYAVVIMLLMNPRLLLDDIGFELSVLATAGLVFLQRPIETCLSGLPERFDVRETIATTLAATLVTMPLVYLRIGALSGLGLIANLLTVPFISFLMLSMVLVLVVSFIVPSGALVLGSVLGIGIVYIQFIASSLAKHSPVSPLYNVIYFAASLGVVILVSIIAARRRAH